MLRRQELRVQLAGSDEVHTVTAINPDYLRIEADMPRFGMTAGPKEAPMTYMTCLAWAAMKRSGLYDGTLLDFKSKDCEALDIVKQPDDDEDADEVRPTTRAADIGSPSPSPAPTATPDSGSPASTTD